MEGDRWRVEGQERADTERRWMGKRDWMWEEERRRFRQRQVRKR